MVQQIKFLTNRALSVKVDNAFMHVIKESPKSVSSVSSAWAPRQVFVGYSLQLCTTSLPHPSTVGNLATLLLSLMSSSALLYVLSVDCYTSCGEELIETGYPLNRL
jgi:hypothetical protein